MTYAGELIGWEVHWGTAEQGNLSDDSFTLGSSDETSTGELMRCKMHGGGGGGGGTFLNYGDGVQGQYQTNYSTENRFNHLVSTLMRSMMSSSP